MSSPKPARDDAFLEFLKESLELVKPFTMVSEGALLHLGLLTKQVLLDAIAGDVVECGVWKGGASFLMARILQSQKSPKKVWMFDSFEGLPEPEEIDGARALDYARSSDSPAYIENCKADLSEVRETCRNLELTSICEIVPGWFEHMLPTADIPEIALLRIDGDWYSSTKICLDNFYDRVAVGGFIVFDDYYTWEGATRAINEFLADKTEQLEQYGTIAYFQKGTAFLDFQHDGFVAKPSILDDFRPELVQAENKRVESTELSRLSIAYEHLSSQLVTANEWNAEMNNELNRMYAAHNDMANQMQELLADLAARQKRITALEQRLSDTPNQGHETSGPPAP